MTVIARRDVLRFGAAAGLIAAAACDSSEQDSPSPSPTTSSRPPTSHTAPTKSPSPTPKPTPTAATAADWNALAKGLGGRAIRPGDADYVEASHIFNPRFDNVRPQGIVHCADANDVAEAVRFASRHGLPVALRSGGHCYAGWSVGSGLVIDVSPMHGVKAAAGAAHVGAGARLIDVYTGLAAQGAGIPAGSCPTVGIAGLTLGGGVGVLGRVWGLTCDSLTAVDIVTADGRVRTCDARRDPDLFWACRGGGGGTFGVVTGLSFRTHPTAPLATWYLSWPWTQAESVISGWLRWLPDAPEELWGSVHISSSPGGSSPRLYVVGTYFGGAGTALDSALAGFIATVGSEPDERSIGTNSFEQTMLIEAGCSDLTVQQCRLTPAGEINRQAYTGSSDWITRPLSAAGIGTLLHGIQARHDTPGAPDVAVQLDAAGGAINRIPAAATAFVHRNAICSVQYIANWYDTTPASAVPQAAAWPGTIRRAMRPYVSGQAYQNYVDPGITDWQQAYFGSNYRRLSTIKARYDPQNLFRHQQSVRPA